MDREWARAKCGALECAVLNYPGPHCALRNGIHVIRDHKG